MKHELSNAIDKIRSGAADGGSVVARFLYLLGVAYERDSNEFGKALLTSRKGGRVYFSERKGEIEQSGTGTNPRLIPGSSYWVLTKSSTEMKQALLKDVLRALGYSEEAIRAAKELLGEAASKVNKTQSGNV